MDKYITAATIKRLREKCGMTQEELANKICVSDKTVSKWETGRGFPDITLIEPLAKALCVSVTELITGNDVTNTNRSFNMQRSKLYVCPVCGNIIFAGGEVCISCHGITLPPLDAEDADSCHVAAVETVEDEYLITVDHEMTKAHFISFIAAVADDGVKITKLYPEGGNFARFKKSRMKAFYFYCNKDGLFKVKCR